MQTKEKMIILILQ